MARVCLSILLFACATRAYFPDLLVGKAIHVGNFSTVFALEPPKHRYLVKMANDSSDRTQLLEHEYRFLNILNDTDLVPHIYPSDPSRFLLVERFGVSLFQYVDGKRRFSIARAVVILRNIVKCIEALHALGVVHGDIHPGNIVVNTGTLAVRLIDFEKSMFEDDLKRSRTNVRDPFSLVHWSMSPWALRGFRMNFHDDLFNGIFSGLFLLFGHRLIDYCKSITDGAKLEKFKSETVWADIPGNPSVRVRFGLIVQHLFPKNPEIDQKSPQYSAILREIDHILAILS
jgi:serine/threonine protein kinase